MMADHIDDYAAIGQAFWADQDAVTASIQRLRAQAYDSGALRSSEQQRVEVQQQPAGQTIYVIQPANPQVVYVPQYDPTVVYVRPASGVIVATPRISFSVGIGIGALLVDDQTLGMGRMGMELGSTPRLLQSWILERLVESLSSATSLVPCATNRLGQSPRLPRQLGLSSTSLPPSKSTGRETWSSRKSTDWPPPTAGQADHA